MDITKQLEEILQGPEPSLTELVSINAKTINGMLSIILNLQSELMELKARVAKLEDR